MSIQLINGDCLEEMKSIPDGSVDMVLADPPYGTTACEWDSIIPLESMWAHLRRVIKPNGAIVMTASQPFTTTLIGSNMPWFKYCWVWDKSAATGHLNAKKMPMKAHEDIPVFYASPPIYNPQKTTGHKRKVSTAEHKRGCVKTDCYGEHGLVGYDSTERYPRTVLHFPTDKQKCRVHPTQKPVALMEYLIKTYTNEGETVLDFCMGSGTTGVACVNLNRNFIGIELDEFYFDDAAVRIDPTYRNPKDKKIDDMLDKFFGE